MVLVNDKKYSCATCIKGHRSGSCTHTDRPLFEVKKKGRPVTQCEHCRKLRSEKQLHIKCECAGGTSTPKTTKKDPSAAAFPNGLRDVHAMNEAADALSNMQNGSSCCGPTDNKLRRLDALLNPCQCQSGGKCKCCQPVAPTSASSESSAVQFAGLPDDNHKSNDHLDRLADVLQRDMSVTPRHERRLPSLTDQSSASPSNSGITPSSHHHPSHSSRYVHKTALYSPYKVSHGHKSSESSMTRRKSLSRGPSGRSSPVVPHVHHDVPVTLPRIREADSEQAVDLTLPTLFPTMHAWDMDGCTCGEGCACPGCTTHPNNTINRIKQEDGHHSMDGVHSCPSTCTSCFDCQSRVNVEPGVQSIQHLIDIAASSIPPPAALRTPYSAPTPSSGIRSPISAFELDPLHMGVLPPTALWNDDAAEAMGLVKLKPLECCNGRCQCSEGMCQCLADCCGCCNTCPCGPELDDENKPKVDTPANGVSGDIVDLSTIPDSSSPAPAGGCCGGNKGGNPVIAEVIEVSDDDSMDGLNGAGTSGTGTPLEQWAENWNTAEIKASESESKSCCSKKPSNQTPTTQLSPLASNNQGEYFKAAPDSSLEPVSVRRPSAIETTALDEPQLSRASSMTKSNAKSQPRPIMPRPASKKTHDVVAVVRSSAGVDHNIVVPRNAKDSARTSTIASHERGTPLLDEHTNSTASIQPTEGTHIEQPADANQTPSTGPEHSSIDAMPNLLDLMAHLPFNPWTGLPNENYVGSRTDTGATPSPAQPSLAPLQPQAMSALSQSPEFARLATLYLGQQQNQNQLYQQHATSSFPSAPRQSGPLPFASFPTGYQTSMVNEQDYSLASTADFSSTNAGMGGSSIPINPHPLPMLQATPFSQDTFLYNQQDPGQLEAMFQRYFQTAVEGEGGVSNPSVLAGSQPTFMQNIDQPPQPVFGYTQESQELQQMFESLSPRSLNAMLNQVLGDAGQASQPGQAGSDGISPAQNSMATWNWIG